MLPYGFYLLFALIWLAQLIGFRQAAKIAGFSAMRQRRFVAGFVLLSLTWVGYVAALSLTGFFQVFTLPPRIGLAIILPAFAGISWFFLSGRFKAFFDAVPLSWPVYFQTFRIGVELLIWGCLLAGLASYEPTLEGYNYDILAGITAPFVAYLVLQQKALPRWVAIAWNWFGLLLLANVVTIFISLIVKPDLWGYDQPPIAPTFGTMPYLLIPAYFMPSAVFMHIFSLVQLQRTARDAEPLVVEQPNALSAS